MKLTIEIRNAEQYDDEGINALIAEIAAEIRADYSNARNARSGGVPQVGERGVMRDAERTTQATYVFES